MKPKPEAEARASLDMGGTYRVDVRARMGITAEEVAAAAQDRLAGLVAEKINEALHVCVVSLAKDGTVFYYASAAFEGAMRGTRFRLLDPDIDNAVE